MKIYILRWESNDGSDIQNEVMAFSSQAKRKNEIERIKKSWGTDHALYLVSNEIDCTVTPTRSGIIDFFNRHAWHNQ